MAQTLAEHAATEVRAELARQRVTQRQLAAHLGLSQVQVQRRLSGRIEFRPSELEKTAEFLGVPVGQFVSPVAGRGAGPASAGSAA